MQVLSPIMYRLELPPQWKIHPMFHAGLLTAYRETPLHGENFPQPPLDLVNGEEEWEVKKIVDATRKGQGQKLHYLIKWKGFPESDNSWESHNNVSAPDTIHNFYQQHPDAEGASAHIYKTSPTDPNDHPTYIRSIITHQPTIMPSRSSSVEAYVECAMERGYFSPHSPPPGILTFGNTERVELGKELAARLNKLVT